MHESSRDNNPQLILRDSIKFIRQITGLELTLIEKVALRTMVINAIERSSKVKIRENNFSPYKDAVAQFMIEYYDCRIQTVKDVSGLDRYSPEEKNRVAEYFRRKQDEIHLL